MEHNEFDALLRQIDHLIDTTKSGLREYYRGYREGITLYRVRGRTIIKFCLNIYYNVTDVQYLDPYSCGFMDGCKGLNLEKQFERLHAFNGSNISANQTLKFKVFLKDSGSGNDIAIGVLEERRRFDRGDNYIGLLKLAKKIFAIKTEGLSNIFALKIS